MTDEEIQKQKYEDGFIGEQKGRFLSHQIACKTTELDLHIYNKKFGWIAVDTKFRYAWPEPDCNPDILIKFKNFKGFGMDIYRINNYKKFQNDTKLRVLIMNFEKPEGEKGYIQFLDILDTKGRPICTADGQYKIWPLSDYIFVDDYKTIESEGEKKLDGYSLLTAIANQEKVKWE